MFAHRMMAMTPRAATRVTSRASTIQLTRTLSATVARATTKNEKVAEVEIPVVEYSSGSGEPHHTILKIDQTKAVSSPIVDVAKKAYALESGLIGKLSPTLAKFTLHGKVALITGAARGLGWNMAQALAEVGVKAIALIDVQQEIGDAAALELHESTGIPVQFYKVDIRDEKAMAEVVTKVTKEFGSLDVMINSAGIAEYDFPCSWVDAMIQQLIFVPSSNIKAEEYDTVMFRRLIDINVTGAFLVAQTCGQQMIKQATGGSIIFIASMSGSIVNYPQGQCCYNASKAAVVQLGKSLAAEWAPYNIRVNMISPGYMDTALNRVPALEAQKKIWTTMTPMNRLGNVDELNNLAVFLASDASSLMTGANCIIDGGYSVW
ncbi:hypothetical protein MMC17_006460 [Xylographa soralifera]|nr:hypothetical protein [Xylographa soralifera]